MTPKVETQDFQIRAVEAKDFNAWLRMRRSLFADTPESKHLAEMKDYADQGNETIAFVAADEKGDVIGFIEMRVRPYSEGYHHGPVGYVEGVWVEPRFRRRGVSHMLLRKGEEWVKSKGLMVVASGCAMDNEVAVRMHQDHGFSEAERLVHFVKKLD